MIRRFFTTWLLQVFLKSLPTYPMKKLYVSQSLIDVESRKELLDQAEIPCMVKNQRSAMLGGEVPFAEVFPLRQPDARFDAYLDGIIGDMIAEL